MAASEGGAPTATGSEPASNRNRLWIGAVIALLAVHVGLAWWLRAPAIGTGQDDAIYLLLGRDLIHGSYRNFWLVGAPPHGMYPPLYPALLGVTGAAGPNGFSIAVGLDLLISVAMLGLFTRMVWPWSRSLAVLVLAVLATNPTLVGYAGGVLSEPLFTLCFVAALYGSGRPGRRSPAATGAFAIAAALARSIGVTIVAAVLVQWIRERRWWRAGILAGFTAIVVGSWLFWTALAPGQRAGQSYWADAVFERAPSAPAAEPPPGAAAGLDQATPRKTRPSRSGRDPAASPRPARARPSLPARIARNVEQYVGRSPAELLSIDGVAGTPIDNIAVLVLGLVVGGFGLIELWRRLPLAVISAACYLAVLLVWPYQVNRFLVPLLPVLVLGLVAGAGAIGARWGPRWSRLLPAGLAGLLVAFNLPVLAEQIRTTASCDRDRPYESACFPPVTLGFFRAIRDAERLTPSDAVLLTPKMATVYYLSGRRSMNELEATSLRGPALEAYLDANRVDHLIVSRVHDDQRVIAADLLPRCRRWMLLGAYDEGSTVLLSRRRRADGGSAPAGLEPEGSSGDSCAAIGRLGAMFR